MRNPKKCGKLKTLNSARRKVYPAQLSTYRSYRATLLPYLTIASDLGRLISGAAEVSKIKRLVFVPSEGTTNFVFVQFRGDFEERLKDKLKEVEDAHGGVVLFIYKMQSLSGLGKAEVSTEVYP